MNRVGTSALARSMREAGVRRGMLATRPDGQLLASHPVLEPVRDMLAADTVDFDRHEAVFLEAYNDCLLSAFVWRTPRGQACGGIRLRAYDDADGFLRDGMRLAIGMGRKSALAGLWYGGGKGVIALGEDRAQAEDPQRRLELMHAYGRFVTSLRGAYVAAEDAGMHVADMNAVFQTTRYVTCIDPELGGSGNPSVPTAMGVVVGMEGALAALGMGELEGKSVAVQGCGNVGGPMIKFLFERGVSRIVAADVDQARVDAVRSDCAAFADRLETHVGADYPILEEDVDIVSPCAFGGVLNEESCPRIKARVVCGAANNQLRDPSTDYGMTERGITYAPDFVVNRMGIVNCANEGLGRIGPLGGVEDPLIAVHLGRQDANSVFNVTKAIVERSLQSGQSTREIADEMANKAAEMPHPLNGHRTMGIIESLIASDWACK